MTRVRRMRENCSCVNYENIFRGMRGVNHASTQEGAGQQKNASAAHQPGRTDGIFTFQQKRAHRQRFVCRKKFRKSDGAFIPFFPAFSVIWALEDFISALLKSCPCTPP